MNYSLLETIKQFCPKCQKRFFSFTIKANATAQDVINWQQMIKNNLCNAINEDDNDFLYETVDQISEDRSQNILCSHCMIYAKSFKIKLDLNDMMPNIGRKTTANTGKMHGRDEMVTIKDVVFSALDNTVYYIVKTEEDRELWLERHSVDDIVYNNGVERDIHRLAQTSIKIL